MSNSRPGFALKGKAIHPKFLHALVVLLLALERMRK